MSDPVGSRVLATYRRPEALVAMMFHSTAVRCALSMPRELPKMRTRQS